MGTPRVAHYQHSKEYYKEVNRLPKVQEPFRLLDGVWKIGKHKGKKLSEIPKDYLQWFVDNANHISKSHLCEIKKVLTSS